MGVAIGLYLVWNKPYKYQILFREPARKLETYTKHLKLLVINMWSTTERKGSTYIAALPTPRTKGLVAESSSHSSLLQGKSIRN